MTRVAAVRTALPTHRHQQSELAQMTAELCGIEPARRPLLDRLFAHAGVETRHTVLSLADYAKLDDLGQTNDLYIRHATMLGEQAVRAALDAAEVDAREVDLLIVTSVTGVTVPSLDARLIPLLGLRSTVKRLPVFGLGCVAGAAGLARMHDYLLAWPQHTAVLLAVELCSLSMPLTDPTTADLVVSGLFGDGAVALVGRGDQVTATTPTTAATGPRVLATRSEVCPESGDVLGWRLSAEGFRIVLTTDLSDIVERHLPAAVHEFLAEHALTCGDIRSWVCHPGGPNVIDAVQRSLGLPDSALATTRQSLAQVGNMSSASILHVLQQTIATDRPPPGSYGLLIGLGPGVSIELVLLRW
jgi:alkylresorcinol/alkylpyrone synthase